MRPLADTPSSPFSNAVPAQSGSVYDLAGLHLDN